MGAGKRKGREGTGGKGSDYCVRVINAFFVFMLTALYAKIGNIKYRVLTPRPHCPLEWKKKNILKSGFRNFPTGEKTSCKFNCFILILIINV